MIIWFCCLIVADQWVLNISNCKMKILFFLCILHIASAAIQQISLPDVVLTDGTVKGKLLYQKMHPESPYYAFKGIPYAAPPVDELRFKPPQPVVPWSGVKVAHDFGKACAQPGDNGTVIGAEDCLTLNVFTQTLPIIESNVLRPVMVWLHGGLHGAGYTHGETANFGPDYLIDEDMVLVTINYRLGILGFLSVDAEPAYGNMGLKDILAALKWVQKNIAKFNGDHNKVTLFGQSGGAAAAELLQISPQSKGLFHNIICQSGSALSKRALQRNHWKYVHAVAKHFKFDTGTPQVLVEDLRKVSFSELVQVAYDRSVTCFNALMDAEPFAPVIEKNHPDAIITSSPYELLRDGKFNKMPFLMGYNTGEGSVGLSRIEQFLDIHTFDTDPNLFVGPSLNAAPDADRVGKVIRDYFMGNSSATDYEKFGRFLSHEMYVRGILKSVEFKRQYSDGYFYRFSYKGAITTKYPGVAHGEELQYLFLLPGVTHNKDDTHVRQRMTLMWANFADTGKPAPARDLFLNHVEWPLASGAKFGFVDLGTDLRASYWPNETEYRFWDTIFIDHATRPLITY